MDATQTPWEPPISGTEDHKVTVKRSGEPMDPGWGDKGWDRSDDWRWPGR